MREIVQIVAAQYKHIWDTLSPSLPQRTDVDECVDSRPSMQIIIRVL